MAFYGATLSPGGGMGSVNPYKQVNAGKKKIPTVLPPAYKNSAINAPKPAATKTGVSSGVSGGSSYNNLPTPAASAKTAVPTVGVDSWIDQLKKSLAGGPTGPKLPGHIDLNQYKPPAEIDLNKYKTEIATIADIAKKYGFDYSREYAERQAEAIAQAQRDAIATNRERAAHELDKSQTDLQHDFFGQYLQQRQQLANSGLNAGIASERNLRLDMNRQNALADILANAQLYNQELDRDSNRIETDRIAYSDKLYNERLQQGFGNAMEYTNQRRAENQTQLNAALQQRAQVAQERQQMLQAALTQRDQKVQEAWRNFEWNNMSAAEKQKLIVEAEKYGMDMAWERHKFDAGMAFQAGYGGGNFNNAGGGGGKVSYPATSFQTSKGTPPTAFQAQLSTAIQRAGVDASWVQPMSQLVANESSWNPKAKNPKSTAHGYAQFLNSTRQQYEKKMKLSYDDPTNQLVMMIQYVKDRYGTPQKAMEFWNKNKWY